MAFHPVDVAFKRVDLAVVRQHAERLRQPPLRECVCGIALVIDRKCTLKALIHQIRVELGDLLSQHHPLVDHRAARQRAHIKPLNASRGHGLLDTAADDIELTLKLFLVNAFGV